MICLRYINKISTMSGQTKISSYFQQPLKKKISNIDQDKAPKKMRISEPTSPCDRSSPSKENISDRLSPEPNTEGCHDQNIPKTPDNSPSTAKCASQSPLSPEQKQMIDKNKLSAKMKLCSSQTHGLVRNMGSSWFTALEPEFTKPYFIQLAQFVEAERAKNTIYPPAHQVWSWTQMGDIEDIKVVILGQDPYHGPGQAHGLCFSVQRGVPPPPSLVNMYKELEKDIPGFKRPGHGFLNGWAKQGVLLLNAVLTVRAANANSHKDKGWEKLTDAVITWLNINLSGVVFILWGANAQKKGSFINKEKHHVLSGPHPSPLSAHRGFFGSKHFSQCNALLEKECKKPIDWTALSS